MLDDEQVEYILPGWAVQQQHAADGTLQIPVERKMGDCSQPASLPGKSRNGSIIVMKASTTTIL